MSKPILWILLAIRTGDYVYMKVGTSQVRAAIVGQLVLE